MLQPPLRSSLPSKQDIFFKLEPAPAWTAIIALFVVTLAGAWLGAGIALRVLFPALSLMIGIYLYARHPILYNGFNWWICFLTPLLRRIADYRSSYDTMSLMLTAPYFVTLIAGYTVYKNLPKAHLQRDLPFVLATFGVVYSLCIGIVSGGSPVTVGRAFLDWLPPILYGYHLSVNWEHYPALRRNTQRVFVWATLVMGAYGIYQYMVAPQWDRFWLENVQMVSFGLPEPQKIRVWSTMNGPAAFACTIMAGLLLLFTYGGSLRTPAAAMGYLAFLLSQVRAAWGAWAVALMTLISSLKPQLQMRLIITICILSLCVFPLTMIEPFSEVISARFDSLSNVEEDSSYRARQGAYLENIEIALSQSLGRGLGTTFVVAEGGKAERVALDSGILDTFFTLGWLGGLPYISGLLILIFNQFKDPELAKDPFASTARSITTGIFASLVLGPFLVGPPGMVLWGFLGISLAARKYYRHQRRQQLLSQEIHIFQDNTEKFNTH